MLGGTAALRSIVEREKVAMIVVSPGYRLAANGHAVRNVLEMKARGIKVYELATFYKRMTGKVPVRYIEDQWLLFSQDFTGIARAEERNLKRLIDILIAVIGLVALLPVTLMVALLIRLTSRGPVLYRQERVGLDKRVYRLLKFRTMRIDAEKEGAPVWASANDTRATRVGRILRRLRLDEIPQFVNVLRGEMSIIGPRPERPYFVEQLERDIPYYSLRFAARPGLTGWAQVNYPYGANLEDTLRKLEYDLYYIRHFSFMLDASIVLKTIHIMLFGKGR